MPFKITIVETRDVKKTVGKTWEKLGTKEVERDERFYREAGEPNTLITDVMGYTPEIEKVVSQQRTVLEQEVDSLNLVAVIKAVNNIIP